MNTQEDKASSSYTIPRPWTYEVFLSFSSEDTRKGFTDHLYAALIRAGIHTFRDENELRREEDISLEVVKAIEESRIALIIFSKNYASSRWCLDELVKILECKRTIGQTVLPIFYYVDPSDVQKQSGTFAQAFDRHEIQFKLEMEKVESWRKALTEAANLSGWDLQNIANGYESKFIQKIVDEILTKVNQTPLFVAKYPVGIASRVEKINVLLDIESNDVRMVGICGMGGVGKTTIAKAIYNLLFHQFEGSSFLPNVRESSKQSNGLAHLQEQLLFDILHKENLQIRHVARGVNIIRERLRSKKVLIVLDDVDQLYQFNAFCGGRTFDWFGPGSRIIVTTRDKDLVKQIGVEEVYEAKELDFCESLELFSCHAFRKNSPIENYIELSESVVKYVGGLPLALEVMGSSLLLKRSIPEWESTIRKLKNVPYNQIQGILRLSFDALDGTVKDLFLDIACFFIGMNQSYVSKILDGCNLFPDIGITILTQRSLVTIDERDKLRMQNLIRDMAKEIVHEESPEEPGRRTRLWSPKDVCDVLAKCQGTKSVEGIILNISQFEDVCFNIEAFVDMSNLRLLQLNYVHLRGGYERFSKKLRWLCWHGFPLNSIPTNFDMENLIVLHMENSCVKEVWKEIKVLRRLKILNLSHSSYLTKTPNFSGLPNLEELILEDCKSLVEVHQSIGYLHKLIVLNLRNCNNLIKLPGCIGMLRSLEVLNLHGCPKQVQSTSWFLFPQYFSSLRRQRTSTTLLPASFSGLCSLKFVNLNYCNLSEDLIPNDFWSLPSLKILYLDGNKFCTLPAGIRNLSRLGWLTLRSCRDLKLMTDLPTTLTFLGLQDCSTIEMLPSNISDLSGLMILDLNGCKRLQSFPKLPSRLFELRTSGCTSLQGVDVKDLQNLRDLVINYDHFCSKSDEISRLPNLESLILEGCERPQTFPKLPSSLSSLFVEGDTSTLLVSSGEIQSMETSQSVQGIYMEGCDHLGNTSRKNSLFQDIHREFEVYGTGSEIPEWISHQNMGSSVSFEVSECSGCKIHGLDVSAVFLNEKEAIDFRSFSVICNKTKDIQWEPVEGDWHITRPLPQGEDVLWVRHITICELWHYSGHEAAFGEHFEVGDQVQVSVEIEGDPGGSLQVKKCGVLLVHRPDEEKNLSNDPSVGETISPVDDNVVMDGEESVLVHIEDENKSGHNEGVAGFSIDAKRLKIGL